MKARLLIICIAALLAVPAVASAKYLPGESPTVALREGLGPSRATTPPASITVNHSDNTLPTVLAAVALGIAVTGTAYMSVRLRTLSRSREAV